MSTDPSRASYFVATYLLSSSSTFEQVWFVNPKGGEVFGRPVYPSLADLPDTPELVDVFRRQDDLPAVAKEVVAIPGIRTFWAQLGLNSPEAADIVTDAGRVAVMNRCLKIEHARFRGGLHQAGFDTGVISSRRQPLL
jgi:predicted CoA-binding protein